MGTGANGRYRLIVNRMTSIEPEIPENWSTPLAPTKPPFLWNAPQGSWTQWRGTIQDPIQRNSTETLGVYLSMNLTAKTPEQGLFDSNARLDNLEEIEDWLAHLEPPQVARRSVRKDRSNKSRGRQEAIRGLTVHSATIPIPTRGPRPTNTASAFLKLD